MSEKSRTRNYYWVSNTQLARLSSGLNLKAKQTLIKEIIKLQDLAGKGKQVSVVSVEEFERFKSEAEAVILQKNRKIMEWENQPVVLVEELEKIVEQLILEDNHWSTGKSYIEGIEAVLYAVRLQLKGEK